MTHFLNSVINAELVRLATMCVALHVPDETEEGYWGVQQRLLQHADRCLKMMKRCEILDENEVVVFYEMGILFQCQVRFSEAGALYERALRGAEKAWGSDSENRATLDILHNLGGVYVSQGRFSDAEAIYKRSLRGREKAFGPEHTSTLNTVNNIGAFYKTQGRFSEAKAMYERVLQGFEKAFGPEHTLTLNIVNNLGIFYPRAAQRGRSHVYASVSRQREGLRTRTYSNAQYSQEFR